MSTCNIIMLTFTLSIFVKNYFFLRVNFFINAIIWHYTCNIIMSTCDLFMSTCNIIMSTCDLFMSSCNITILTCDLFMSICNIIIRSMPPYIFYKSLTEFTRLNKQVTLHCQNILLKMYWLTEPEGFFKWLFMKPNTVG